MAIISSIRKRAGLIVVIIGFALFAFVIGDFQGLFTSQEQYAGEISGQNIPVMAFENEVQRLADEKKMLTQQAALSEEAMAEIRDEVWARYINDIAFRPQYANAGISVCVEEVRDMLVGSEPDDIVVKYFSDRSSGQLDPRFADPKTGKLNPYMVKQMDDTLNKYQGDERYAAAWHGWLEFQSRLPDMRSQDKYFALIKKGLYVTAEQAKQDYLNLNTSVNFSYVLKPYSSLADSLVTVDDQEILKYYNENQYKYKQEASRKLEYVIFDIKPTGLDSAETKASIEKLAEEWKLIKSEKEDSFLVVREAEERWFDTTFYGKGKLFEQIDSIAHASEKGTVLAPYIENNQYKLCKVIDTKIVSEVKARHILIKLPEGDTVAGKIKAKAKIDSLRAVIKKDNNFEEMARQFSDDGSAKDGGDLGWFTRGAMVPAFDSACFKGKKGDIVTVYTRFGYHLIEIMDKNAESRKTQLATINRTIEAGTKTRQDVYNKAIDFITNYHSSETFDKGVEALRLVKRLADQLKENDKSISEIENPRDIIRWAYKNEKGAVSTEPFSYPDKYVVAHLADIREAGVAPLEQKKEEVTLGAKKAKKAEKFIEEMNKLSGKPLEAIASGSGLQVNTAEGATFSSYTIPNVGREMNLYGPIFSMKQGGISKPIAGESGVFIIRIDKVAEAPITTDYANAKAQAKRNYTYRVDGEVIEVIKKKAEITDNRAKFF